MLEDEYDAIGKQMLNGLILSTPLPVSKDTQETCNKVKVWHDDDANDGSGVFIVFLLLLWLKSGFNALEDAQFLTFLEMLWNGKFIYK